ncbi:MAG: HAMP domain-containing sensor histidine kinase [Erysipelothrix sp.]
MKNKYSRTINIVSICNIILYIILCSFYLFNLKKFPVEYQKIEQDQIDKIQIAVKSSLDGESSQIESLLAAVTQENPVDLLIYNGKTQVYNSSSSFNRDNFSGATNNQSILFESRGTYTNLKLDNFDVFIRIYRLPYTETLVPFIMDQFVLLALCFLILIICLFVVIRLILSSIIQAKNSLELMLENEFKEVALTNKANDTINESLRDVSTKINHNLDDISREYSQYEQELEKSRLYLDSVLLVSRSFIHDLKTPIVHQIYENEIFSTTIMNEESKEITEMNISHGKSLITQINDILKFMNQPDIVEKLNTDLKDIDINALMIQIFRQFKNQISGKHLDMDFISDESVNLHKNEVLIKLLLHNIISNMTQYASNDSTITVSALHTDNDGIELSFTNTTDPDNIRRMLQSQNLFNILESNRSHEFSSGQGLFLIKTITEMSGGIYTVSSDEDTITVSLLFSNNGEIL